MARRRTFSTPNRERIENVKTRVHAVLDSRVAPPRESRPRNSECIRTPRLANDRIVRRVSEVERDKRRLSARKTRDGKSFDDEYPRQPKNDGRPEADKRVRVYD